MLYAQKNRGVINHCGFKDVCSFSSLSGCGGLLGKGRGVAGNYRRIGKDSSNGKVLALAEGNTDPTQEEEPDRRETIPCGTDSEVSPLSLLTAVCKLCTQPHRPTDRCVQALYSAR